MSVIDNVLSANESYAARFNAANLPMPPARKLAVLACMDARMHLEEILGLKAGDAHIIRNAGGIASVDAVRSLIISHYLLGTQEFMIVNHTDCGMLTFKDDELRERLRSATGETAVAPEVFNAFSNLEGNVREQMARLRSHPWIPRSIPIRGFVYDVKTGRLNEVAAAEARRSTA